MNTTTSRPRTPARCRPPTTTPTTTPTTPVSQPPDRRGPTTRRRPTDIEREAERLATGIAASLGDEVRRTRRRRRLTQARLGALVGLHQTRISDIERGRGRGVPLETWVSIGVVLGRPLAMALSRPIDPAATLADAGHLDIQEAIVAIAMQTGRHAEVEVPSRPQDPRHATDVVIGDDQHRTIILMELWNTFGDLGGALRSTTRKRAEMEERAVMAAGPGGAYRVASVWVVRATPANRALVARYPSLFAATFTASSRDWVRAVVLGTPPPSALGLVWFDGSTDRVFEWRGRRS